MWISLGVGFFMLGTKLIAYWITGSVAILSDAAESVVHVVAVSFAAYSLWLSQKPADRTHHYGHDRIAFFSAGFEGAMIVLAAVYIMGVSVAKWVAGLTLERLSEGTLLVLFAALINGALGGYLVWTGRKYGSLILIADGKHVLTDCWTSLGVIVGLSLARVTGWLHFDPILALFVALNILWSGSKLVRQSVGGLMDESNPAVEKRLRQILDERTAELGLAYHGLRHRNAGSTLWVEFHLLFPKGIALESAHAMATKVEESIQKSFDMRAEVTTHLETVEDHREIHTYEHHEHFSD
jgi:cation diffusion facilitator family transporter